ncbi:MAG TPA: cytochrome ubiquinol oxidase subunit I [bacterium]
MDATLLARWQFALTVGFHFIFPPISIGLAWLVVTFEGLGWKRQDEGYLALGKLFGKLMALTFAVGVATGIVMEFQFGMNWAEYSKFVGDIFGAPLAAEGIYAFFLESAFMGLYLFGRGRVSKGMHWFSSLMVAVGATISAFWIIVANSWQQTPAGFTLRNGRAELTSFADAVFNPSTLPRFFHTLDSCLTAGAFFVAGVAAYMLFRGIQTEAARKALRIAIPFAFIVSVLNLAPFGHEHAKQVARTQPSKFAAIEGLYVSQTRAPLVIFGIPFDREPSPELRAKAQIPGMLSWMAFGHIDAPIKGINDFAADEIPPLWLSFVAFHNMVVLGMLFIGVSALGTFWLWRKKLWDKRWFLQTLIWCIPLPVLACEFGWTAAEVGRQPWIVYGILRTSDAVSKTVPAGNILLTMILLCLIYTGLLIAWIHLSRRLVKHGADNAQLAEMKP